MKQWLYDTYFKFLYFLGWKGSSLKHGLSRIDYELISFNDFSSLKRGLDWGLYGKGPDEYQWFPKDFDNKDIANNYGISLRSEMRTRVREDGLILPAACNTIRTEDYKFSFGHYRAIIKNRDFFGSWNAFWLFTNQDGKAGEIDIFEYYNKIGGGYYDTTIHYGTYNFGSSTKRSRSLKGHVDENDFHQFDMVYTEKNIKIYFDNRLVRIICDKKIMRVLNNTTFDVLFSSAYTKKGAEIGTTNPEILIDSFYYEKY